MCTRSWARDGQRRSNFVKESAKKIEDETEDFGDVQVLNVEVWVIFEP